MNDVISVPVLVIGFNRPDVIAQTFEYITKAKPTKLYVAIDGPRSDKEGENELVDRVKQVVEKVDWDCDTHYKYNDNNLGAEVTVSSAVSWVLENEKYVIVLEDDIIAPMSFLRFAQEMLIRYENQNNIYMVSGIQRTPIPMSNNEDYLFGLYGHIWGWATWKRAWDRFDLYVNDFDEYLLKRKSARQFFSSNKAYSAFLKMVKRMKNEGVGNSTWDYCWSYIREKEGGLSIIPRVNLTSNIGVYGLHANGRNKSHFAKYDKDYFVQIHPSDVMINLSFDDHHFRSYLSRKTPIITRIIRKIKREIKNVFATNN